MSESSGSFSRIWNGTNPNSPISITSIFPANHSDSESDSIPGSNESLAEYSIFPSAMSESSGSFSSIWNGTNPNSPISIPSIFPANHSDSESDSIPGSNETYPKFSHNSNSIVSFFPPARSPTDSTENYEIIITNPSITKTSSFSHLFPLPSGPTSFSIPLIFPPYMSETETDGSCSESSQSSHAESIKLAFQQIMEALRDDNSERIGLHGLGGVGKTTLVKEVYKKTKQLNIFDEIVMTVGSFTPNVRRIQGEIAGCLNLELDDESDMARASQICLRIKTVEKILIILDDVWKDVDLEAIGIPSCDDHRGCKMLLTTRSVHICNLMRCQRKIPLNLPVIEGVDEDGVDEDGVDEDNNAYACLKWSFDMLKRKTK